VKETERKFERIYMIVDTIAWSFRSLGLIIVLVNNFWVGIGILLLVIGLEIKNGNNKRRG